MGARSGGGGGGYGKYYSQYSPTVSINQSTGGAKVGFNSYKKGKKDSATFGDVKSALTFANKLSKSGYKSAMDFALKKGATMNIH